MDNKGQQSVTDDYKKQQPLESQHISNILAAWTVNII